MNVKKLMSVSLFTFLAASLMFVGGQARADSNDRRDRDRNDRREERRHDRDRRDRDRRDRDERDRHDRDSRQPRIVGDISTTNSSATISFKAKRFRNETVNVIVSVKDKSTDNLVEKAMKAKVDENGNGSVKVTGLKANTRYEFKVRIMGENSERSTKNSSDRSASTSG